MTKPSTLPQITLLAYTQLNPALRKRWKIDLEIGADEISKYGALGCFEKGSSRQLILQDIKKLKNNQITKKQIKKKTAKVLRESAGRGHGAVADQNYFIFSIEDLPREATLGLCLPQYAAHLQQSLRRAKADRGYFISKELKEHIEKINVLEMEGFKLYEEMASKGIPREDARYVLSLKTRTNIQTGLDARELIHYLIMVDNSSVPYSIKYVVGQMRKKAEKEAGAKNLLSEGIANYEPLGFYPAAQLYSRKNILEDIIKEVGVPNEVYLVETTIDKKNEIISERNEADLAVLKHQHLPDKIKGFLLPISIAGFHQSIRQRTWDHAVESLYNAFRRGEAVIPPSIEQSKFRKSYLDFFKRKLDFVHELIDGGINENEAIGFVPHALQLYDMIHINGWNAIHALGKRLCTKAQWEIRRLSAGIAKIIKNTGEFDPQPQCVSYGKCPERKSCGYLKAYNSNNYELMEKLLMNS